MSLIKIVCMLSVKNCRGYIILKFLLTVQIYNDCMGNLVFSDFLLKISAPKANSSLIKWVLTTIFYGLIVNLLLFVIWLIRVWCFLTLIASLYFILTTDFSYNGLGGMLSHFSKVDGKLVECPIMFCSHVLKTHKWNYSQVEGEMLTIIFALKHFVHVLYGSWVVIRTNHKPLQFMKGVIEHNRKLSRWWILFQDFDYRLDYLEGKTNVIADCLSWIVSPWELLNTPQHS